MIFYNVFVLVWVSVESAFYVNRTCCYLFSAHWRQSVFQCLWKQSSSVKGNPGECSWEAIYTSVCLESPWQQVQMNRPDIPSPGNNLHPPCLFLLSLFVSDSAAHTHTSTWELICLLFLIMPVVVQSFSKFGIICPSSQSAALFEPYL